MSISVLILSLSLLDLRGNQVELEDFRDRLVVVNFWATWCQPCIREMPDLIRLHDRFAPYGVEFVAAAADSADQREGVLAFVRKHKINFPVLLGATTEQMQELGLPPTLPGTVVLDEHGCRIAHYPGVIDRKELEAKLARLVGLPAEPPAKPRRLARARPHRHDHGTHAALVPS